jgi:hypothetical protein
MGSLRGKLRKVWDISRGRYWSDFVILGSEPDILDLASYAAYAFSDAIFASVDKLAQLPSIGRNEAGIPPRYLRDIPDKLRHSPR